MLATRKRKKFICGNCLILKTQPEGGVIHFACGHRMYEYLICPTCCNTSSYDEIASTIERRINKTHCILPQYWAGVLA